MTEGTLLKLKFSSNLPSHSFLGNKECYCRWECTATYAYIQGVLPSYGVAYCSPSSREGYLCLVKNRVDLGGLPEISISIQRRRMH